MSLIQITNLQPQCQESRLDEEELRQIVGGVAFLNAVVPGGLYWDGTSASLRYLFLNSDPVNKALDKAMNQAVSAGNVTQAQELDVIIYFKFQDFMAAQESINQIVAPG